jgi:hypothetical protein
MQRIWRVGFVLLGLCVPAFAQVAAYIYTPLGYQQISPVPTGTTLTVPNSARIAEICVETNSVRYRDDGTNPTTTVGMPVVPTSTVPYCFQYSGNLVAITFIQVTSPATLDVSYYR